MPRIRASFRVRFPISALALLTMVSPGQSAGSPEVATLVAANPPAIAKPAPRKPGAFTAPPQCEPPGQARRGDSPRVRNAHPAPELRNALARFGHQDPGASFTFFNCEVDSFATKPKATVPAYALPALHELGLDTTARPVLVALQSTLNPRPVQNLDADLRRKLPLPEEEPVPPPPPDTSDGFADEGDNPTGGVVEQRTEPPIFLDPPRPPFVPPSAEQLRNEARAVVPILTAFLAQHDDVFRMRLGNTPFPLTPVQEGAYQVGQFFRKAVFEQALLEVPVIESRTIVMFDLNWNVIAISRMLVTPQKLPIAEVDAISQEEAVAIARRAVATETGRDEPQWDPVRSVLGVDAVRRMMVWQVQLLIPKRPEFDRTVLLDAATGDIISISNNTLAFLDAKVRRWSYSNGDVTQAFQINSTGQYTRDDNTLTHDFFFMATDQRGDGDPLTTCTETASITGVNTLWRDDAYGSTSSSSFIRHTHRPDRDFSIWSPGHSSGSFQESHTYYWSRHFFQWLKPALNELGVLPASASDYDRALFIANACIDDVGLANSSFAVTTQHNEGEGDYKLRLVDGCRSGNANCDSSDYAPSNSNHYITCEGNGCNPAPSVVHHEIIHFILGKYFGVGSSLDCGAGDQRKFLHEGAMGSVVPQAFWHTWYGVGYNPATDRLFTADQPRGRVHAGSSTLLTRTDYPCSSNLTGQGPYNAGRVAGQALWEFYHGKKVDGNTVNSTWSFNTDTDFLILVFWASDLVQASTFKDRWEIANRVMEILDKYSNWSTTAKSQYCDVWDHHELDDFINDDYCS